MTVHVLDTWPELKRQEDLHYKLNATSIPSQGHSLVPKLKREHLELTSFSCIRVDLAAQVISLLFCVIMSILIPMHHY